MNKKSIFTVLGFLLFFFGFMSLILSLFGGGLRFTFLSFIDELGQVTSFVIKTIMLFGGMVIFYISRTDNSIN